ncbi:hypothetical protein P6F34_gp09 [Pseudomonas phage MiCath]|uniref:Uncharacterized protein n=1 Tax=Pseudomonas phage MiCath TaxID=3003729 RepID=A0AAF0AGR2_9CAUD|nr:hypothetical protein P6F34_gp09 [Pseudomonas phage MiCath]WAX22363.1 hypothetical protein [Pseudomonas phage MiCath]
MSLRKQSQRHNVSPEYCSNLPGVIAWQFPKMVSY